MACCRVHLLTSLWGHGGHGGWERKGHPTQEHPAVSAGTTGQPGRLTSSTASALRPQQGRRFFESSENRVGSRVARWHPTPAISGHFWAGRVCVARLWPHLLELTLHMCATSFYTHFFIGPHASPERGGNWCPFPDEPTEAVTASRLAPGLEAEQVGHHPGPSLPTGWAAASLQPPAAPHRGLASSPALEASRGLSTPLLLSPSSC